MFEHRQPKIRNLRFNKAVIIVVTILIGNFANAQEVKTLSKEEAIQIALSNNSSLKAFAVNASIIKSETK